MEEKKLYIGTYSDKTITDILTKEYENKHDRFGMPEELQDKYDKYMNEYISNKISNGVRWAITQFFAKDLSEAKTMAKNMGLKNFSQVCDTLYEVK